MCRWGAMCWRDTLCCHGLGTCCRGWLGEKAYGRGDPGRQDSPTAILAVDVICNRGSNSLPIAHVKAVEFWVRVVQAGGLHGL